VVHDLVDLGEGIGVLDSDVIEFLVVDYQAFHSILLSDEEDWGCGGALV